MLDVPSLTVTQESSKIMPFVLEYLIILEKKFRQFNFSNIG
jgi:hypothetical protein